MKPRSPVITVLSSIGILMVVVVVAAVIYFNTLYNLLDRTEITGNPTIEESDLADPEDLAPLPSDPSETAGTSSIFSEPTEPTGGSVTQPTGPTPSGSEISPSQSETQPTQPTQTSESTGPTGPAEPTGPTGPTGPTQPPTFEEQFPIRNDPDVYNILLVGVDTRAEGFGGRSDSMIILSINKRTQKIHMVSLARNLLVRIEGHDDSMLNYAYSWGGINLLIQTINQNFRLDLRDYLVINFSGFIKAIDYCGGVDIKLTTAEVEYMYLAFPDGEFKVGTNHLNGDQALVYARIRWIDSDYSRTGRQRKVLDNLIYKLKRKTPAQINSLMTKVLPLMRTNLTRTTAIELAIGALQYKNYPVTQLMLPIAGTSTTVVVRGTQMASYDGVKNVAALHRILYED